MSKFNRNDKPAFSVTVSGDLAPYEQGQVLTKDMDIADYFRVSMAEGDVVLTMDDAAMMAVIKSIPYIETEGEEHGSTDWEVQVQETLESRNNSNTSDRLTPLVDMSSDTARLATVGSIASSEGVALDADEQFRKELHTAAQASTETKRASLKMLLNTLRLRGYEWSDRGILSSYTGLLDHWPRPGSTPTDTAGDYDKDWRASKTEKNLYAKYYTNVGSDKVEYDWYADLVQSTEEGKAELKLLNDFRSALQKEPIGPYKSRAKTWNKNKKRLHEDRLNAMIRAMKGAASCYFQMKDIATDVVLSKNIGVGFVMENPGKDNQVTDGLEPLVIWDKETAGTADAAVKSYSVSGFNNLDIEKALTSGGMFNDLVESTGTGTQEKANKIVWELNAERYRDNIQSFAEWMKIPGNISEIVSDINSWMKGQVGKKRTSEANHLLVATIDAAKAFAKLDARFGGNAFQEAEDAIEAEIQANIKANDAKRLDGEAA